MLNIIMDDEFKESFEAVLSTLVPNGTDSFESKIFTSILKELRKIIYLNDLYGEWYILYSMILNLDKIKQYNKDYVPKLKRELLDQKLQSDIYDYVNNKQINAEKVCSEEGLSVDLKIDGDFDKACDILYTRTLALYDRVVDKNSNQSEDGFSFLQLLGVATKKNLAIQSINAQTQIINDKLWIDKVIYAGIDGVEKFLKIYETWMVTRFKQFMNKGKEEFSLTSIQKSKEFREDFDQDIHEIFRFGFDPLDDTVSICNSDVITIIGDEGVGKTNFAVDQTVKCLASGRDVLFMTGESSLMKIRYMVLARYIWEQTGHQLNWKEIASIEDLPDEEKDIIDQADFEMTEGKEMGKLHLVRKFTYETVYKEISDKCEEYPNIGMIVIDHANRLNTNSQLTEKGKLITDKQRVDYLYDKLVDVSDEYDICCMVLSHSSTTANQDTKKDKKVGVRSGAISSSTSKDADIVLYLRKNDLLKAKGMIKIETLKIREGEDSVKPFLVKRVGTCSGFEYDESDQIEEEDEFDEEELSEE